MVEAFTQFHGVLSQHGGLALALLLAGLVGGFTRCAGMRGPFVVEQVATRFNTIPAASVREWKRLRGTALIPYHVGRVSTYILLGVSAALLSAQIKIYPIYPLISAMLLGFAAILFIGASMKGSPLSRIVRWLEKRIALEHHILEIARPFFGRPTGWQGFVLGALLGLMPCGMTFAAVMTVAASGDPAVAAFGMLAFGIGTVPALFVAGYGTRFLFRRSLYILQPMARGVMAANSIVLLVMAGKLLA